MGFSNSVIHAPMTAYQIEIMTEAVQAYQASGGYQQDVEYLVEQLNLYRTMLLLKNNFEEPVAEPSISPVFM